MPGRSTFSFPLPLTPRTSPVTDLKRAVAELKKGGTLTLSAVPEGLDAFCVAELTQALARDAEKRAVVFVHVARDEGRARAFAEALTFADPRIEVLDFPAWDCQPYDRVSPNAGVSARRMTALSRLSGSRSRKTGRASFPPRSTPCCSACRRCARWPRTRSPPRPATSSTWTRWCTGWRSTASRATPRCRTPANMPCAAASSISTRPRSPQPVRLDFFGDTLESIRAFDPETQRTTGQLRGLDLVPMSEVQLTTDTMKHFRQAYVAEFGARHARRHALRGDQRGAPPPRLEHWLPLFYDRLDTMFDYTGDAPLMLDAQVRRGGRRAFRADRRLLRRAQERARARRPRIRLQAARSRYAVSHGRRNGSGCSPPVARAGHAARAARRRERSRGRLRRARGTLLRARARGREPQRVRGGGRARARAAGRRQARRAGRAGPTARASASPACSPTTA